MTPSPAAATLPKPAHAPARTPAALQALVLAEPIPGFPGHRDYVLVPAEDGGRLFWLQSMAPDGPRFLAGRAAVLLPGVRAGPARRGVPGAGSGGRRGGRAVLPPDRAGRGCLVGDGEPPGSAGGAPGDLPGPPGRPPGRRPSDQAATAWITAADNSLRSGCGIVQPAPPRRPPARRACQGRHHHTPMEGYSCSHSPAASARRSASATTSRSTSSRSGAALSGWASRLPARSRSTARRSTGRSPRPTSSPRR